MIEATTLESLLELIHAGERVVVLFTQPATCVPCRQFRPHFERAAGEVSEITFVYVDLDSVPGAMVDYDIRSVPTVKLYEHGTFVRDVKAPQGAFPFIADIRS